MESRKRKLSLNMSAETPTSSNVSKSGRNIPHNTSLPNNKRQIEEIVRDIAKQSHTTKTSYLLLRKLQVLSETEIDRITVLMCLLSHMNTLYEENNKSDYVKVKVLDIIRQNTEKLINNGEEYIEELSRNMQLAKFIMSFFADEHGIMMQNILFQFLTLIINHIKEFQNDVSNWEFHLIHCNYFFGNNVLCLLANFAEDDSVLLNAITTLEVLSQDISTRIDFLTYLYKLENLVPTVIKCFWQYYRVIEKKFPRTVFQSPKWWEFLTKWQMLIININKRNSVLTKCLDNKNLIFDNICILKILNIILHYSKITLCESSSMRLTDAEFYPAFSKCILLFQSFSSTLYTPQFDQYIIDFLQHHKQYLQTTRTQEITGDQSNASNEEDLKIIQDNRKVMEQYLREKLKYWNKKCIMEMFMLPSEVLHNVNSIDINIPRELIERQKALQSSCYYLRQ